MGGSRERGKRGGVGWPASTLRRRWRFAAGWMASFKAAGHGQHGVGVETAGVAAGPLSHMSMKTERYTTARPARFTIVAGARTSALPICARAGGRDDRFGILGVEKGSLKAARLREFLRAT